MTPTQSLKFQKKNEFLQKTLFFTYLSQSGSKYMYTIYKYFARLGLRLLCLTPLSTIFHLYRVGHFNWRYFFKTKRTSFLCGNRSGHHNMELKT